MSDIILIVDKKIFHDRETITAMNYDIVIHTPFPSVQNKFSILFLIQRSKPIMINCI